MRAQTGMASGALERDRLLLVGEGSKQDSHWIEEIRRRYPSWEVASCESYLSGIAELSRKPARAVLACVDGSAAQLDNAVAGLREAAGPSTRLVLCCTPEAEPITRRAMQSGANDYILLPFKGDEIDAALGYL